MPDSSRATCPKKYPVELLDRLPACGNTWLMLRGFDTTGRGIVEASLDELATALSTTKGTIRNHITQGRKLGLYRAVKRLPDSRYRFYLHNAVAIALALGIQSSIQCVWLEVAEIRDRKLVATEVTASVLQNRSAYKAHKASRRKGIVRLEDQISKPDNASDFCRGHVVWKGKRYLFVSEKAVIYGGSQEGIGKLIERSPSTIKRRLSGTTKRQVAVRFDHWHPDKLTEAKRSMYWDSELLRYFVHCGYVFKACCNVYQVSRPEARARRWNRRLAIRANKQGSLS